MTLKNTVFKPARRLSNFTYKTVRTTSNISSRGAHIGSGFLGILFNPITIVSWLVFVIFIRIMIFPPTSADLAGFIQFLFDIVTSFILTPILLLTIIIDLFVNFVLTWAINILNGIFGFIATLLLGIAYVLQGVLNFILALFFNVFLYIIAIIFDLIVNLLVAIINFFKKLLFAVLDAIVDGFIFGLIDWLVKAIVIDFSIKEIYFNFHWALTEQISWVKPDIISSSLVNDNLIDFKATIEDLFKQTVSITLLKDFRTFDIILIDDSTKNLLTSFSFTRLALEVFNSLGVHTLIDFFNQFIDLPFVDSSSVII